MREVNMNLVVGLLRRCDAISQIELLKQTGLSAGTVFSIVKELRDRGFLDEIGPGQSVTGRKPVLLRFNPQARLVVAIELTSAQTRVALVDLAGRILMKTQRPTQSNVDPQKAIEQVGAEAMALTARAEVPREKLLGVGVSVEGIIDADCQRLVLAANLGWRDVPVKSLLESALGVPVVMNNGGGAIGEYLLGPGKGSQMALCVEVDSGVGAMPFLNGRMLRGVHGMAGEIGHNLAVPDGEFCSCGRRGCLETVVSAGAIVAQAVQVRRREPNSRIPAKLSSLPKAEAIRRIAEAAATGDTEAKTIFDHAGRHLGIAVAGLVNFLDPELVILTGMVAYQSGGLLLDIVRTVAAEHMLQNGSRSVRIEQGTLGDDASLIGAAATVSEQAFRIPVEAG